MLNAKRLTQYQLVSDYVQRTHPCSRSEIIAYLEAKDVPIAGRTFDRIKGELQVIGIYLEYQNGQGYSIKIEEKEMYERLNNTFIIMNTLGHLVDEFEDLENLHQYVRMSPAAKAGQQHLQTLLQACIKKRPVRFIHTKYQNGEPKEVTLDPYQIRENDGRWYIIGVKLNEKQKPEMRSLGLDRISNLEILNHTFEYNEAFDPDLYYRYRVGIGDDFKDQPENIVLEVDVVNWNWIRSNPWHHSQKLLSSSDKFVRFGLFAIPSMGLQREIMAWAPLVKVIEPPDFKKRINDIYKTGLLAYKT